jgi:hypothetical protein
VRGGGGGGVGGVRVGRVCAKVQGPRGLGIAAELGGGGMVMVMVVGGGGVSGAVDSCGVVQGRLTARSSSSRTGGGALIREG